MMFLTNFHPFSNAYDIIASRFAVYLTILTNGLDYNNTHKFLPSEKNSHERTFMTKVNNRTLNTLWISGSCRAYSTKVNFNTVFPYGLSEENFSFNVNCSKNSKLKLDWRVRLDFIVKVHSKDSHILEDIKNSLNTGSILSYKESITLKIQALDPILKVIIPYFEKYPLKLKKTDFLWWKEVAYIKQNQEHLTPEGLAKIMKLQPSENQIVLWGTNLSSTVGLPTYSENVRNIVRIPANHQSVITGLILSDGWLSFGSKKNTNARLGFKQSLAHFGYFWFVFNNLAHYCNSIPTFSKGIRNETKTYALIFQTRSLPCFTILRTLWYPEGKKIVPENIYDSLTPIALAEWINGDGTTNGYGLTLCTESFNVQDLVRLLNVLILKYGLKCTLHKQRNSFNIYISEVSMPLLRTIVIPHIHSSIYYKLRVGTNKLT